MKRTIQGVDYDTTRKGTVCLAQRQVAVEGDGGGHMRATIALYRSLSGRYFIHGRGGMLTLFAAGAAELPLEGGERIVPLTLVAAHTLTAEFFGGQGQTTVEMDIERCHGVAQ